MIRQHTLSEKAKAKKMGKIKLAEHIAVDYPEVKRFSTNAIIKYKKALDGYPDLKNLDNPKLVLLAYDFRQEQVRRYHVTHTTEMANGRCNIQIGGFKKGELIPTDLPVLQFEKECVVCHESKKVISVCPECWHLIRKAIEIKGKQHRDGWDGWGNEMSLDLSNVIRLLKTDQTS